jgi:hypothetical protein
MIPTNVPCRWQNGVSNQLTIIDLTKNPFTCATQTKKVSTINITFSGQQCGSWTIEFLEETMDVMEREQNSLRKIS